MTRTRPNDAWVLIPDRARGYQMRTERTAGWWWFTPDQKEAMEIGRLYNARFEDTSHKLPAGGLVSTASDLARFGTALLEGRLISEAMLRAMLTERTVPDSVGTERGTGWGLGLAVGERNGHRVAGLNGGQAGVSAALTMVPQRDLVIAAIANRDLVPLDDLVRRLAAAWGLDLSAAE
jgi:CubicO group peptidase (beta-lactamase class C family)